MKLRVFTLRFDPMTRQFDDEALRSFVEGDREVIEVRDHFFETDGQPAWGLLVTYREALDIAPLRNVPRAMGSKDTRSELAPVELKRFEAIRAWRNERMQRDGKPPYVALNNKQIAAVARRDPATLTALGELEGIGEAKLRDYGAEILAVLAAQRGSATAAESAASPKETSHEGGSEHV